MRVVIAGGSGWIGQAIAREVLQRDANAQVVILQRGTRAPQFGTGVAWDSRSLGDWAGSVDGADVVINLVGEPIAQKWTPEKREAILRSRVDSTVALGRAIERASQPPRVWINSSATGFYGDRGDERLDERSLAGSGFLAETCVAWEDAFFGHSLPETRQVAIRTGMVLGLGGGALDPLQKLTRLFLGGAAGPGSQWVSWIHLEDLVRLFLFAAERPLVGPVNGVSPEPCTNSDLMATLRRVVGRPWSPPAPTFALKLMGATFGPDPSVVLESVRAFPKVASDAGFSWDRPQLEETLRHLLKSGN